jgi:hypothetical protein
MNTKLALKSAVVGFSAIALSAFGSTAQAVNLVTNGSFSSTSTNGPGQLTYTTNLTGWTNNNNGYNFVFASGTADGSGLANSYGNLMSLWGPNNGSNNGLTASSPDGGNFIVADGDSGIRGAISQTITGLTAGKDYIVSFWEAAAQQYNYNGDTTEQWQVSFGSQTQLSTKFELPNHGFSGWNQKSLTFTANATSQTLSFLALGTPNGLPPFSLLDGVAVNAAPVPEPFTIVGTMVGLGLGARLKSKLNKKK